MTISIKYFASLAEKMGKNEEQIQLQGISFVSDIIKTVTLPYDEKRVLIAVNQEYAKLSTAVKEGDEVAFFPPVTGG